ncbi:hypothetical protein ACHQM5_008361 [Ranunculus cassubicifolius]
MLLHAPLDHPNAYKSRNKTLNTTSSLFFERRTFFSTSIRIQIEVLTVRNPRDQLRYKSTLISVNQSSL